MTLGRENGTTTCEEETVEDHTCTVICDRHKARYGYWTCLLGQFRGNPTCLDKEGDYWQVIWVRPVVVGSFDLTGELRRGVECSNETLEPFAENITKALAFALTDPNAMAGVEPADFNPISIYHM